MERELIVGKVVRNCANALTRLALRSLAGQKYKERGCHQSSPWRPSAEVLRWLLLVSRPGTAEPHDKQNVDNAAIQTGRRTLEIFKLAKY